MDEDDNDKSGSNKFIFNDFSQAEIRNFRQKIINSTQIPEDIKGPLLIWFSNAIAEQKWRDRERRRQAMESWLLEKTTFLRASLSRWWSILFFLFLFLGFSCVGYHWYNYVVDDIKRQHGYINLSAVMKYFSQLKLDKTFPSFLIAIFIIIIAFTVSFFLAKLVSRHRANKRYGKIFNYKDHDLPEIYDQE